jgi:rRNA maturation RNase YbeY
MREGRPLKGGDEYLGDIIISIDAAQRQAKRFGSTRERELKLYLIHGVLHLLGYDDEKGSAALYKMRRRERFLLTRV